MRRVLTTTVLTIGLGLGLTGCGLFGSATSPDGGGTSTHSSAHGAAPAATRAASAPRVTGAASNQARSATPGPPAPQDYAFQIGAKTIACLMTSTEVRCDIRNHAWKPANPGHCDADQSPGMRVNTKGVAYTCSDRPLLGHGPVLAHNTVVRNGGFVCTMVTTQVTCLNGSGHGFTLSRLAAKKV